MKILRNILCFLFAFLLCLTLLAGAGLMEVRHILASDTFLTEPAQVLRSEQAGNVKETVLELAETYGFDPADVLAEVDEAALTAYGGEVVTFLRSLQEVGELIFPYYMTDTALNAIRNDAGFQEKVERTAQRMVSQEEIVRPIEKAAQNQVFPLRPQLIIAAYNMVSERISVDRAVQALDKWWLLPCCSAVLLLVLLLVDHRAFLGWAGSSFAGTGLMILSVWLCSGQLGIESSIAQVNPLFARYVSALLGNISRHALICAGVLLVLGLALLAMFVLSGRKMRKS